MDPRPDQTTPRLIGITTGVAALALGAALLLGQAPGIAATPAASPSSPATRPAGPGPASPRPPSSPLPIPTGPLFPLPSTDPLDTPSGGGTGVEPPAEIVGSWYTGDVSDIGYVDPNTGSYSVGGSEGVGYAFAPDGTWQYGFLITSSLYGCTMRVMVFRTGVVAAVDAPTHLVSPDTQVSQMHSEDDCVESNNYDRELEPDDETIIWERTTDEYGEVLLLRGPTTDYSVFRPAQ